MKYVRITAVILALVLCVALLTCCKSSYLVVGCIDFNNSHGYGMEYQLFNGERTYQMHFDEETDVTIKVVTASGFVSVKIIDNEGNAVYEGNSDGMPSRFIITLPASEYEAVFNAVDHKGSINVQW